MQGKVEMQITDIGEIPAAWGEPRPIKELFDTYPTASVTRDELSDEGNVFCIHYGDIHTKFGAIVDANKIVLPATNDSKYLRYTKIKEGDLIIADTSEDYDGVGKGVSVIGVEDKHIIAGLHTLPLRDKDDNFDTKFLGYYFSTDIIKSQLESKAVGTKVYSISYNSIGDCLIPVPPKDEQTRIAKALSEMDDLIISLDELIEKKNAIKQGAMQKLLSGEIRLKGYSGEWVFDSLGECEYVSGSGFPLDYQNGRSGDYAFFKVSDFNNEENKKALLKANNYITKEVAKILACNIIPPESIVIAKIGAAIYLERKKITVEDCCIDNNMLAIISQKHNPFFLRYYLETLTLSDYAETTALPYLCDRSLSEVELFVPEDKEEQTAIANIISDIEDEITQLEAERDKYKLIREGMAQQLLTGKIRLI